MPKSPDFPSFIKTEVLTQDQRDYFLADIDFGGIDHEAFLELLDSDEPDDRGTGRLEASADEMDTPSADLMTPTYKNQGLNLS